MSDSDAKSRTIHEGYVVGIGASAGGLQALEALFDHLPPETGMAFVVIQHLSPDFDSMMDQLISRHSRMNVTTIKDGMPIEANSVYVLPPGCQAIVSNKTLLLTPSGNRSGLSFPIDEFLRSLAQDLGERAIGIILSGTGTDGSRGIGDIHAAGGLVIAQTRESAGFDGMPKSAIDSGLPHLVQAPVEIARSLVRLADAPSLHERLSTIQPTVEIPEHFNPDMKKIFQLLYDRFSVDLALYKPQMIIRRVERRMNLAGMQTTEEYLEQLAQDERELNQLFEDMLIGVTQFFRDPKVFERLQLDVIPEIMNRKEDGEEVRVWVAGAASGEEAYSLAILIAEEFERRGQALRARIFASDLHPQSLAIGGRGVYSEEQLCGVTPERRQQYFISRADGFHVVPELRKLVVFTPHNVTRDAPFTRLDLVSCRNLLIYLSPPTQQRVLSLFHFGLNTNGFLCLGNSESLGELESDFHTLDESLRIYRKQRELSSPNRIVHRRPTTLQPVSPPPAQQSRLEARDLFRAYDRLLDTLEVPAILVSSTKEILHILAGASRFLQPQDGRPTNDLLSTVQPELRAPLSLALISVWRDKRPTIVNRVNLTMNDESVSISIRVDPLKLSGDADAALIRFEFHDANENPESCNHLSTKNLDAVEQLERELQFTQNNLQATIEKLQTTNEELQATNEQLTASNEELQSTNEELHSVNEELYTVNSEHQRKIEELTELNDDIDNLLTTTNVHTLFLDSELRLRRFTPGIAEIFNLIPQDVGRRIDSFTHKLTEIKFVECAEQVISSEKAFHREIRDKEGQWYLLRIFPYLARGTVEGAVVTLVDVTTLQQATEALQKSEERFHLAVRGSNAGIWDWQDLSKEPIWCSERMYSLLGISEDEELTASYWQELIHPEDADRIQDELNAHLKHNKPFDVEYRMEYGDSGEYRWFHMRGAAQRLSDARSFRMAGSFEDVTKRRIAEQEVRQGVMRRDQFLAMLSHELRNPLAAVTSAIAVMTNDTVDTDTSSRAAEAVGRQLAHMAHLLDDLLDVSRITHGKIELRKKPTDIGPIAQQAVCVVQSTADEAGVSLEADIPASLPDVDGDPVRLQQVLVNLLTNAIKYTHRDGAVLLRIAVDDEQILAEVADNGAGIPPDRIDEIFSLFYQSDETLDRSDGGMGVGLTLVKAVVELHGGTVSCESDGPGFGSRFTIRLPVMESAAVTGTVPPTGGANAIHRIALVEDIDDSREMLATLLQLLGYEVDQAGNGTEGLELIRRTVPDVALIDIGLPEMSGHEVARHIREDRSLDSVRLVALTGYGQDSDREEARESGFDVHIIKPLDPQKLEDTFHNF